MIRPFSLKSFSAPIMERAPSPVPTLIVDTAAGIGWPTWRLERNVLTFHAAGVISRNWSNTAVGSLMRDLANWNRAVTV